ncbi:PREDICTED: PR domain zinc finger protein 14-like isoform X2 [Priapulus caudatus]|nr:PREDICTED: PR domain zinc finger protein 14-like isoform X2 [Priapulus caudatus]
MAVCQDRFPPQNPYPGFSTPPFPFSAFYHANPYLAMKPPAPAFSGSELSPASSTTSGSTAGAPPPSRLTPRRDVREKREIADGILGSPTAAAARYAGDGGRQSFAFSRQELDVVLYGYTKAEASHGGHAVSCVRIDDNSRMETKRHCRPSLSVVDPLKIDVPKGVAIVPTYVGDHVHHGVFCDATCLPKGTRFGPFMGKTVNMSEIKTYDDNTHMWEIFLGGQLSHFVDGRGPTANWLSYVNNARFAQEQNLIAVQENSEIYYEACKEISKGKELLVWYGDSYMQFLGIPVALKDAGGASVGNVDSGEHHKGYPCERCGKVFAYDYYRDKHLKYTRCVDQGDRKFPCHLCSRSFEKRDRLRIHVLHVHEKHRPHKCTACDKSFSQSSSLNKHMRVHSGERPYKCVYCSKAFTASSILRTHIRQHSGEKPFKCKYCGKSFASHAAHDSHVRRTHGKEKSSACHVCGQVFAQAYELKFHMKVHAMSDMEIDRV